MITANLAWGIGVAILLIYEAYALLNSRPGDTLSEAFWRASRRPLVPFALGVLVGHFVWQSQECLEVIWKLQ